MAFTTTFTTRHHTPDKQQPTMWLSRAVKVCLSWCGVWLIFAGKPHND
jgi:hypothetical protein